MLKKILVILLFGIFVLTACKPVAAPVVEAPVVEAPPAEIPTAVSSESSVVPPAAVEEESLEPILEVIGPEQTVSLSLADIKALPASEGKAGIKSSTGKITLPNTFTGVSLLDLANLVGGLNETMGINIVAEDGYSISYSFDQIMNGNYIAYNKVSGDELKEHDPLTAILAYKVNGEPLNTTEDGNLRLVIISEKDNQVTDGHWSVKWVAKVEVRPMIADWVLDVNGAIDTQIDRASFESCVSCHEATWTDDKGQVWKGIELWRLMGYADDGVKHEGWSYDVKLAKAGYDVHVIAADGFETVLWSDDADRNHEWVVAMLVDDQPMEEKNFPLKLVGSGLDKKQMVGAISLIQLDIPALGEVAEVDEVEEDETATASTIDPALFDFSITGKVDQEVGYSEADIRNKLAVVIITAEHPKSGSAEFEGILLSQFFSIAGIKTDATSLLVTADDGYSVEIPLADVLAQPDCMLAFTNTPGKFKLVMPGLPSSAWVKNVVNIDVQ